MDNNSERINILNDIITGIVNRSSYKFFTLSREDLIQDLWLKILEVENKNNELLDFDLAADICFKKLVDIQRYEMRRNHLSIDDNPLLEPYLLDPINKDIRLRDLFNLFPEGSKERTFLEYWGAYADIDLPECQKFQDDHEGTYRDGFNETDLAKKLGYSSSSHRGYRQVRYNVRATVAEYLGIKKEF